MIEMSEFGRRVEEQRVNEARNRQMREEEMTARNAATQQLKEGRATIESTPLLDDEAKIALRGLVATYKAAGVEPQLIVTKIKRIPGKQTFFRKESDTYEPLSSETGWLVKMNSFSVADGGMSDSYHYEFNHMIVTPDERIMLSNTDNTHVSIDNTLVKRSVTELILQADLPWVDPS